MCFTQTPCLQRESVIAVRAPSGTSLEIPECRALSIGAEHQYKILLTSVSGQIEVYAFTAALVTNVSVQQGHDGFDKGITINIHDQSTVFTDYCFEEDSENGVAEVYTAYVRR